MYNKEDRAVANDRFRAIMKQIQKLDQEEEFKSACFGTTEKYRNEITKLRIQIAELQTKVDLYEKYISYCADHDSNEITKLRIQIAELQTRVDLY